MTRLVIDTDVAGATVGGDIDDGLALLAALRCPDVSVDGVIVTGGDLAFKVAQVRRIFELVERSANIGLGAATTLSGRRARDASARPPTAAFLSPHRSTGGLPHGVDLLCEQAAMGDEDLTLLVLGPATTLALALLYRPSLSTGLRRVVLSAGCIGRSVEEPTAAADPLALWLVLRFLAPKATLVGLDVASQFAVSAAEIESVDTRRGPLQEFLVEYCQAWLRYHALDHFHPQDSLALLAALEPETVRTERCRISMDPWNRSWPGLTMRVPNGSEMHETGPEPESHPIEVAVEVDVARCTARLADLWGAPELAR